MAIISKLLFNNIFDRHFPVNHLSIQQISDKDLNLISFWIKEICRDIETVNSKELNRAEIKAGHGRYVEYRILKWIGDNPMTLHDKLTKRSFSDLSDTDIAAINNVIHFHKFKNIFSCFIRPTMFRGTYDIKSLN